MSKALTEKTAERHKSQTHDWRNLFKQFDKQTWKAASGVIHDDCECPAFTADDMTEDWSKVWCPSESYYEEGLAEKWKENAQADIDILCFKKNKFLFYFYIRLYLFLIRLKFNSIKNRFS